MILSVEDKKFIKENSKEDIADLALKTHRTTSSMGFLLTQIQSRQKAMKKLPSWVNDEDVVFFSKLSTEQCSSEKTAEYKASLVSGDSLLDLCSGFGVDDVLFSKVVKKVTALELNKELVAVVQQNHKTLGCDNIEVKNIQAEAYLSTLEKKVDWIYVDPARRDESNRKLVSFQDCSPNVLELDLFQFTDNVLFKASPMMDIRKGIEELDGVKEVHVVAINNEVKELLFLCEKEYKGRINCVCVDLQKKERIESDFFEEDTIELYSEPKQFVYEPNVAIMKAHLFSALMQHYQLDKLHPNTNLFTSDKCDDSFQGRVFEVVEVYPYKPKLIKKAGISQANVIARNFFLTPEDFKKKFKIKDGGAVYLLLCTDCNNQPIVIFCKRVK